MPPTGLEPMSLTSVAFRAQFLNVPQPKLGTIIIQIVHILQLDSADTGSLPIEDIFKHNPNHLQITKPYISTITPPYQWRTIFSVRMTTYPNQPTLALTLFYTPRGYRTMH